MEIANRRNSLRAFRNVVYLLHFDSKLSHAQHYIGSTKDLRARLAQHSSGRGARLIEVIQELGIEWSLARVWHFDGIWAARKFESHLKRSYKNGRRLCPVCRAERAKVATKGRGEAVQDDRIFVRSTRGVG